MQDQAEHSFMTAVEPLRGAIRLHCYRMLGSSHDGDDIVQETMLRAWRARDSWASRVGSKAGAAKRWLRGALLEGFCNGDLGDH